MSMISTALTGLTAAQRALEVTSNNVANANTDGYVRRRVVQAEAITAGEGTRSNVGSGVQVTDVQRLYDSFLTDSLRGATSSEQRSQAMSDLAARLDSLLGNPELGISTNIQAFFTQLDQLGQDPTSASARQQVLVQADSLTARFRQLGTQLGALSDEVDNRIVDSVSQINSIAAQLAKINATLAAGSSSSNDLTDQRDALLAKLTSQIDARVTRQLDGTVAVTVGSGQPLVLGVHSATLQAVQDQYDPSRVQVAISLGSNSQLISRAISGGTLGGLLAFRSESLDPANRELGLMAASLANIFNSQHAQGVDANGNLGGDFFTPVAPIVSPSLSNSGSAVATVADPAALQSKDYVLLYNGTAWSLTDAASGAAVTFTGTGAAASPFTFDGLSVTASGATGGDSFLVRPVANAASRIGLAITDPAEIAAAAPVQTARLSANLSNAAIVPAGITDVTDPALLQPVQIRFETPTTYRIYDGSGTDLSGPLAYTSGGDISFNGWTVRISGTAQTGDRFNVGPTGPSSGNNTNAQALARTGAQGYLANGQISVEDLAGRLVSDAGSIAARANQDLTVQSSLREQAQTDLDAISGVNLDEEAANMLRYQQAYQASSKVIVVANELFNTLLSMLR